MLLRHGGMKCLHWTRFTIPFPLPKEQMPIPIYWIILPASMTAFLRNCPKAWNTLCLHVTARTTKTWGQAYWLKHSTASPLTISIRSKRKGSTAFCIHEVLRFNASLPRKPIRWCGSRLCKQMAPFGNPSCKCLILTTSSRGRKLW